MTMTMTMTIPTTTMYEPETKPKWADPCYSIGNDPEWCPWGFITLSDAFMSGGKPKCERSLASIKLRARRTLEHYHTMGMYHGNVCANNLFTLGVFRDLRFSGTRLDVGQGLWEALAKRDLDNLDLAIDEADGYKRAHEITLSLDWDEPQPIYESSMAAIQLVQDAATSTAVLPISFLRRLYNFVKDAQTLEPSSICYSLYYAVYLLFDGQPWPKWGANRATELLKRFHPDHTPASGSHPHEHQSFIRLWETQAGNYTDQYPSFALSNYADVLKYVGKHFHPLQSITAHTELNYARILKRCARPVEALEVVSKLWARLEVQYNTCGHYIGFSGANTAEDDECNDERHEDFIHDRRRLEDFVKRKMKPVKTQLRGEVVLLETRQEADNLLVLREMMNLSELVEAIN